MRNKTWIKHRANYIASLRRRNELYEILDRRNNDIQELRQMIIDDDDSDFEDMIHEEINDLQEATMRDLNQRDIPYQARDYLKSKPRFENNFN